MLELLFLFVRGFLFGFRSQRDLALENLVLRHQLQVALRTNRLRDSAVVIGPYGFGSIAYGRRRGGTY